MRSELKLEKQSSPSCKLLAQAHHAVGAPAGRLVGCVDADEDLCLALVFQQVDRDGGQPVCHRVSDEETVGEYLRCRERHAATAARLYPRNPGVW